MRPLTPLCELAVKHRSDKGGRHLTYGDGGCHATHEYTPVYWDLLHAKRETVKSVLEIGVNQGCGLRMWEEFFPNAQIIGIDINPACIFAEGRIKCFVGDQNSAISMHKALSQVPIAKYDLIVDDGSHELVHQANTMEMLLPVLADGGLYIIEDIARDQWRTDHLLKSVPRGYMVQVVLVPLGTGQAWPEQLFIVTRE